MKNTSKIIAGVALIASLASCSSKVDFKSYPYVRFDGAAYTVTEDAGTVRIPVYAYAKDGDLSFPRADAANTEVTFEVKENSAKLTTNFTVEPANGVLTFDGESVAYITLNIVDLAGVYTSDLDFTINLTGATNDFTLGGISSTTIKIKDNDHPLANILGNYVSDTVADYWGDKYNIAITINPVEGSTMKVTVDNLCPYTAMAGYKHSLEGEVNADKTEIVIPAGQWVVKNGLLFVVMDTSFDEIDNLVLSIEEDGTITCNDVYGAYTGNGWYDIILPPVIFRKQ